MSISTYAAGTLDSPANMPTSGLNLAPPNNPSHGDQHEGENDAVIALETKVGVPGGDVGGVFAFPNDKLVVRDDVWRDIRGYVLGTPLDRTGAVDMGPKLAAALADVNATFGGIVALPAGNFLVNVTSTLTPLANTTIRGAGRNSTFLYSGHATRVAIALANNNCVVENLACRPGVASIGGSFFSNAGGGNSIRNVEIVEMFGGIEVTGINPTVERVVISCTTSYGAPASSFGVKVSSAAVVAGHMRQLFIQSANSTNKIAAGIWVTGSTDVTWDECDVVGCTINVNIAPSAADVGAQRFRGCYFDRATGYNVDIAPTSTGTVHDIEFDLCYMTGAVTNDNVRLKGVSLASSCERIFFTNCYANSAGRHGYNLDQLCRYVRFVNCRAGANTGSGWSIATTSAVANWSLANCHGGLGASVTANGAWGLITGAFANTQYSIDSACTFLGNVSGAVLDQSTGAPIRTIGNFMPFEGATQTTPHILARLTAAKTISGTVTETSLLVGTTTGVTIPAKMMGAAEGRIVRVTINGVYKQNKAASTDSFTLYCYYTNLMFQVTSPVFTADADNHSFRIVFEISNYGSTTVQLFGGMIMMSGTAAAQTAPAGGYGGNPADAPTWSHAFGGFQSGANSDSAQTIDVRIKHGTADANIIWDRHNALIEVL